MGKHDQLISNRVFEILFFIVFVILSGAGQAAAATYWVDIGRGGDSNDGLTKETAWKTLHHAFGALSDGDTLNILGGDKEYSVANGEDDSALSITTGNVTIVGRCRPVLAGKGAAPAVWKIGIIVNADGVTIEGLEIINFDGGIFSEDHSPVIQRNLIHDMVDTGTGAGSAIILKSTSASISPRITNNILYSCQLDAISIMDTYSTGTSGIPLIYHNTIDGGTYGSTSSTIGVSIESDGGVSPVAPDIKYNIISNFSHVPDGIGIENVSGNGNPLLDYNCFYNNYTDCSGCSKGAGDIVSNPMYAFATGFDYHLRFDSHLIDVIPVVDDPVTDDFEEKIRPYDIAGIDWGGTYDMGAYEQGDDPDRDGLTYDEEVNTYGTLPDDPDTDGDGYHDGEEVYMGSDPHGNTDIPAYSFGSYWVDSDRELIGLGTQASPWQSLHHAIHHINNGAVPAGSADAYTLYVDEGVYRVNACCGGWEPDEALYIEQKNLIIIGDGAGQTIIDGDGSGVSDIFPWIDAFDVQGVPNVIIRDLEIKNFKANGIHLGSATDCTIEACSIHDNLNNGVLVEYGFGSPPSPSSDNVIQNGCVIHHNGHAGILFTDTARMSIKRNILHDNNVGIEMVADAVNTGAVIRNNLIYGFGTAMAHGILMTATGSAYLDHPTVYNNTIDGGTGDGIRVDAGDTSDPEIFANIITNFSGIGVNNVSGAAAISLSYNDVWNNGSGNYSADLMPGGVNDISLSPGYEFATGGDYRLKEGSPCIDPIAASVVCADIDHPASTPCFRPQGSGYDMGCYERPVISQTYSVNFTSGAGGSISGDTAQTVNAGDSTTPVTAVPAACYHFTYWSDNNGHTWTSNPLTLTNVTADMDIRSDFARDVFNVTFSTGPGGSITGDTSQAVPCGEDCMPVTAMPDKGYEFTGWSGDYTGNINPLTITNVTSGMHIRANFEKNTHTVIYTAGSGGSIMGDTSQEVLDGGDCSEVKAVPDSGYRFTGWSGDYTGTDNPLRVTDVTSDMNITANFVKNTHNVNTRPSGGGNIEGDTSQQVNHGENSGLLTAVPEPGYHFTGWSGDYTGNKNPLVVENVTSDMNITANFEINTYTVTFNAGTGGHLTGDTSQSVDHGSSCSPVTAVADPGYQFDAWTGDYTGSANPLTVTNVVSDMTITASFVSNLPPDKPGLISPVNEDVSDPANVLLKSEPFSDPEGDEHLASTWQIRRADEVSFFYEVTSSVDLTAHEVGSVLETGLLYKWRVGYTDAGSRQTTWSSFGSFIVGKPVKDNNVPPIPPGINTGDYRMVSFVQWPTDYAASSFLADLLGDNLGPEDYRIGTYDPEMGDGGYVEFPDFQVMPGRAYWFLVRFGMRLDIDGVFVNTDRPFKLNLSFNEKTGNGWNMVGCPNRAGYYWYDVVVAEYDPAGATVLSRMPVSDLADENEYIDRRIWRWVEGRYVSTNSDSFLMKPYEGYWVKAKKKNLYLIFLPETQVDVNSTGVVVSGLMRTWKTWVTGALAAPEDAFAGAGSSDDSPPQPMGALNEGGNGGNVGCFISTSSHGAGD